MATEAVNCRKKYPVIWLFIGKAAEITFWQISGVVGIHDCKLTKRKYEIKKFIWKNKANNTEIEAITLGATVTRIVLPDRNGMLKDILLGFDCHEDRIKNTHYYMGSMIGRCANMISNPIFQFDGVCSNLSINRMKKYHFNGGCSGFNKVCAQVSSFSDDKWKVHGLI